MLVGRLGFVKDRTAVAWWEQGRFRCKHREQVKSTLPFSRALSIKDTSRSYCLLWERVFVLIYPSRKCSARLVQGSVS